MFAKVSRPPAPPAVLVDLVETATAGDFTTMAAALEAAGLVETLKRPGPFTIFAPTERAFAALPKGSWLELMKPENRPKLRAIVKGHVMAGKVMAADVMKMHSARTVAGGRMTIRSCGTAVTVDGANIRRSDVMATNGVMHVIDAVLLPK